MSECQLVLEGIRQESKAKRILWFFKPKEIITWEPFDLQLTFRNNTDEEFPGGKCTFMIRKPSTHNTYDADMPSIKPKESKTVVKKDLRIDEYGYVGLTFLQVKTFEQKPVSCVDIEGKTTSDPQGRLFFVCYKSRRVIPKICSSCCTSLFSVGDHSYNNQCYCFNFQRMIRHCKLAILCKPL